MAERNAEIKAVTLDSFSTLVDPASAGRVLEGYVDAPDRMAHRWHELAVRFATVGTMTDRYHSYYDLHRFALDMLLRNRGYTPTVAQVDEMTAVYHELDPFDDTRPGLQQLHDAGYSLAILSNGNPSLLDSLLDAADIRDLIDQTISADEIRAFKPAEPLYRHAAQQLNVPIEAIAHVGAGWSDMVGCMHAGMTGVWLNRKGIAWPKIADEPAVVADSMADVTSALSE